MINRILIPFARRRTSSIAHWFRGHVDEYWYSAALLRLRHVASPTSDIAVAVHLYHAAMWPAIAERLRNLGESQFDLYITLPPRNRDLAARIRSDFPAAQIMWVPNRGRDVLPFVKTASLLHRLGYVAVLKLHTKTSQRWFNVMVSGLLPADQELIADLMMRLRQAGTGVVGPSESYFPLSIFLEHEKRGLTVLLAEHFGDSVAEEVLSDPSQYGFFGGTMFWSRLDTLAPLLRFRADEFEREAGQWHGTLAHVLERLFTIYPELSGRLNYEVTGAAVKQREPACAETPSWYFGDQEGAHDPPAPDGRPADRNS